MRFTDNYMQDYSVPWWQPQLTASAHRFYIIFITFLFLSDESLDV